ncbi:hypothetical protein RYX36_008462 [Vicia faba]
MIKRKEEAPDGYGAETGATHGFMVGSKIGDVPTISDSVRAYFLQSWVAIWIGGWRVAIWAAARLERRWLRQFGRGGTETEQ